VVIQALYTCKFGFCRYTLGDEEATELITAINPYLHGYAFTPDGAGILWAQDSYPTGEGEILLADLNLRDTRTVTMVQGLESGAGGLEGYGVLGMTADARRVLYEHRAQLFVANVDGSDARAVLEQRPYGSSSTHSYALSPSGLRVLYTMSGNPNQFEVANVDTRTSDTFALPPDRRAVALVDDTHVLIERFEPPVAADANPTSISRWSLGYEVAPLDGGQLDQAVPLREDDGSYARWAISNVAGDWLLIKDEVPRAGDDAPEQGDPLWLLNVRTGARQDIHLPYFDNYSLVAIAIVP
jgi:hypothetical protein